MTIKNFNKFRADVYNLAIREPDIADALYYNDRCYLYDVVDGKQQHGIFALTAESQLNSDMLKDRGFDPETSRCKLMMTLDRKTKCATFFPRA